jgi:hypothetical protein
VHEALHVAVLVSTLAGAASLALLIVWPLVGGSPLPRATAYVLGGVVLLAAVLLIVEWQVVH